MRWKTHPYGGSFPVKSAETVDWIRIGRKVVNGDLTP
jgi:hypothetical protein